MANNNINVKVGADYSELTGLIKTTDQTKRALKAVSAEFANTKDQSSWMRGVNQIIKAQDKLSGSAKMTRSEIMKLAHEYKNATQFSNALAVSSEQVGRRMSRSGVMVQQAGYQVGDFIVQVQSGTNAFVAFGQQATQIAGTLTLLGGRMIAIGTGLGIAIPLVTAFAAAWSRTRKDMDDAKDSAKGLEDRITSINKSVEEFFRKEKALKLGITPEELDLEAQITAARRAVDEARDFYNYVRKGLLEDPDITEEEIRDIAGYDDQLAALASAQSQLNQLLVKQRLEAEREASEQALNTRKAFQKRALALYRKHQEELRAAGQASFEINDSLTRQIILQNLIISKGKESAAVKAEVARQERDSFKLQQEAKGLNVQQVAAAMRLYDEKVRLEGIAADVARAERDAADEARELARQARAAAAALRGLENIGNGIAKSLAVAKAELVALNNEASTGISTKIAGQRFDLRKALIDAVAGGADRQSAVAKFIEGNKQLIELEKTLLEIEKKRAEQQKANSKGSGARIKETLEMTQALKDQIQVFETLESSLESGFMSMVDGTKSVEDAFREMAKSVVSELYKVYVLQKMIGGLGQGDSAGTGILGFIQGFLGLPNIPGKRASGGTVMPNQPYLVGEKGPELIMPQNRGHVMNADLTSKAMSGGESVTVVQNFSFQANGDESVKRIIAQAAPSIANMAKQSVMDARRRGGAMKNTFG